MEAFSEEGKFRQDSMLHGALTFTSLLKKGNGMYYWWENSTYTDEHILSSYPDYGSCTVTQLLLSYDEALANYGDYYTDDGLNPCFQDPNYLEYSIMIRSSSSTTTALDDYDDEHYSFGWDYVVMNDQSMSPAIYNKRIQSASSLQKIYGPMLLETNSMPILYQTWAYWRDDIDMSDFVDISTFTYLLKEGYEYYASILEEALPDNLKPRIAPVGIAFLVIWEENISLWKRLFGEDQYHPSPHGTYLAALIIYSTIYKCLPPASSPFVTALFSRSRMMQISGESQPLPTEDEAIYLRWIAMRVVLHGYIPKSLRQVNVT